MTDNDNDILQLRFDGNGISPERVKPSEISELINEFQNALLSTIKQDHPEVDTDAVLFYLEDIKHESLGLNFRPLTDKILPAVKDVVVGSYLLIATSIETGDYSVLNRNTIQSLKKISGFSKKYNCNGQFNHNGQTLSVITPNTEIKEAKIEFVKGNITIYGEINEVGNNIHIKMNDGSTVYVDTDKPTAKVLGSRLWETVGLKGVAKWDPISAKISEFKLVQILDYSPGKISEAFARLRDISSGVWDEFNTNDAINKQLLRE